VSRDQSVGVANATLARFRAGTSLEFLSMANAAHTVPGTLADQRVWLRTCLPMMRCAAAVPDLHHRATWLVKRTAVTSEMVPAIKPVVQATWLTQTMDLDQRHELRWTPGTTFVEGWCRAQLRSLCPQPEGEALTTLPYPAPLVPSPAAKGRRTVEHVPNQAALLNLGRALHRMAGREYQIFRITRALGKRAEPRLVGAVELVRSRTGTPVVLQAYGPANQRLKPSVRAAIVSWLGERACGGARGL
jgi:hypothetical protein